MHLFVNNLGRISEASLDIRPFTVFIGPTNTNKTWTAYALYGLTNNLSRSREGRFLPRRELQVENDLLIESDITEIVDQLVGDFVGSEAALTETTVELHRNHVIPLINHKPKFALGPEGIATLLDTSVSSLNDARVELQLELHEFQHSTFDKVIIDGSVESGRITSIFFNHQGERSYGLGRRSFFGPQKPTNDSDFIDAIKLILREAVQHLVYSCFGHVAVLPAERKALVWMLHTVARFGYIRRGFQDGPIPLGDFLSMLMEAENVADLGERAEDFPKLPFSWKRIF